MSSRGQAPNGFDEAIRYYRNARELLGRSKINDNLYEDIKPVRESFGTAWLAIDMAVRAALKERGLTEKQMPRSWEDLRAATVKHLAVTNGRLVKLLNAAYNGVHLAGYYRGMLAYVPFAKEAMNLTRQVIETLSGRKVA
ncbi:MAG: DUF5618 family protein [Nitrospirae bacterium]|nr:DUF5618 family protein [Nitrospirota bacterium]